MTEEKWVQVYVNGIETNRIISNKCRIKDTMTGEIKNIEPPNEGYSEITVRYTENGEQKVERLSTHKVLAECFIPNPNNYSNVRFKDGNHFNLCVENLEWFKLAPKGTYSKESHANKSKYGRPKGPPGISRPIRQYDLEGNFIAEYYCIAEASRQLGIPGYHILRCCEGWKKRRKNHQWRYADEPAPGKYDPTPKRGKVRKVAQYDMEGNLVAIYDSVAQAHRETGFATETITKQALGYYKTSQTGYKWKYVDDEIVQ